MIIPLADSDLLIKAPCSFLLIGPVREPFILFIETSTDEYCQHLIRGDLIAVSAPEGGDIRQAKLLLELVRTWHTPLVVLQSGHPGSGRLKMIVSAGDTISLNCSIQRGTHPEQTVICSSEELAGLSLHGLNGKVKISNLPSCAEILILNNDGTTRHYNKK
ncbi:MAG: alpha/beta hydrolase [Methanomicrobiales archaeon HGW-Methanomicrobiales-4]|nr:MAG: alpha/beta hydrolase [Methanomicrobiales archaeon HGW-Methanomicrobiales-4]